MGPLTGAVFKFSLRSINQDGQSVNQMNGCQNKMTPDWLLYVAAMLLSSNHHNQLVKKCTSVYFGTCNRHISHFPQNVFPS